jgi:predicted exporter
MTAEQAPGQVLAPYSGPRVWQRVVVGLVCAVLGWMVFLWVLVGGLVLTLG